MWTIIAAAVIWGLMGGIATAYVRSLRWKRKQIQAYRPTPYVPIMPDLGRPAEQPKGCRHDNLVPVTTESEREPVRYICISHECYEEFEPDSGVAKGFLHKERRKELRRKADREFAQMFSGLQDDRAQAIEQAAITRAELAAEFGGRHLMSRGGTNNIVNRDYGVFTTGYQPSEWDNVR